ncbi:uroporphyrinogen-III synthase [Peteryoungia ipomoeae]|uniref:Uroporphyrinogen-III synthase n=1 Tax=Peteryoungia ipomoeae TaxID=1210932 RepID=A0A4S8P3R3_9HYPH|nr:uroporphyrinogen-III synthase [Peteryoungia ipomoeae]THV22384.1 uroporphyrinogen-III synthase [Peteryoungia ipomoeae]
MRVVVTRPQPSAARTAAALEARGHTPILLPLMQAQHTTSALLSPPPDDAAAVIVTSSEALRALATAPEGTIDAYRRLPLYAVGQRTEEAARTLGFSTTTSGSGDGRNLASQLLQSISPITGGRLVYLAGEPRSPDLEEALSANGLRLDLRICYRMLSAEPDAATLGTLSKAQPDAVLLYSSESARRFEEVAKAQPATWSRAKFFCLSEKIATSLSPEKQARACFPMEPREDLLLQLLDRCVR